MFIPIILVDFFNYLIYDAFPPCHSAFQLLRYKILLYPYRDNI